jgi:hypothetical protein
MNEVGFSFRPSFGGGIQVDQVPEGFFDRIERRLASGWLVPGTRHRANYRVIGKSREAIEFEAVDFGTAYAIGLNHVVVRQVGRNVISYEVTFERWNRYALIHGALLGTLLALVYAAPLVRQRVVSYPHGPWLFWGTLAFWALAWPWLLTAIHRPFAARALDRILRQELSDGPIDHAAP